MSAEDYREEKLSAPPSMLSGYAKAALGALPLPGGGGKALPRRRLTIENHRVDTAELAEYTAACGLRLGSTLPLTYGFVLTFPSVMALLVDKQFPLPAMGMVHIRNVIDQQRPVGVDEPLDISVWAQDLRPHDKGTQVDFVSEIRVGRELVWRQTSTFLKIGGGTGGPKKDRTDETPDYGRPVTMLRVDQRRTDRYAAVSGDRNPIHVSKIGAKLFGFPTTIAHGMWSAAAALGAVEGRIADKTVYDVRFGKPVILPARIAEFTTRTDTGWDIALRHPKKLYPYLTATLTEG